jgi:branched-chain amino acid transport system ATP-binding protein
MSQELFRAIKKVRDMGVGVLMVEQNVNLSLDIADRGYLIETGRMVGEGTSDELRNDPAVQQAYLGGRTAA